MNKAFTRFKRITTLLVGIFFASIPAVAQADWSFTGLSNLGGKESYADSINDSGQVAGYFDSSDGNYHAFITGPNGVGMTDLSTLGGGGSFATGINDSGQVAGYSYTGNGNHAFITGPNGAGMTDLGTLVGGRGISYAAGINDSGQVAGYSYAGNISESHAFITGPNGVGMTDLGTLGGSYSNDMDINDSGEVVGRGQTTEGDSHNSLLVMAV